LFIGQFTQGRAGFAAVADCLAHYAWPGNVRELRNVMERRIGVPRRNGLARHLPGRSRRPRRPPPPGAADTGKLEEVERQMILRGLRGLLQPPKLSRPRHQPAHAGYRFSGCVNWG
jgi:transcriptional regulator with AAA-type ATPase domain